MRSLPFPRLAVARRLLLALGLVAAAPAQETAPLPQTVEEALHQMADASGVIFVGEVSAIHWKQGEGGASGLVEVVFRVEDAVRGCASGESYTLREWAGLWAGGVPRYTVGQRLLLMLYPAGAAGISSPVGGMDGAIPLRATTAAPLVVTGAAASGTASLAVAQPVVTPEIADLRWVGTRLLRTLPAISSPIVTGATQTGGAASGDASQGSAGEGSSDNSVATQQAPVTTVLRMLRSWPQTAQAQNSLPQAIR